ncbi:MAG: hypothetical protein Q7W38_04975 [Deltaproteobacteria bacterium]|nr:hypothetical protein [Deltaproteobacteria bacterium]
MKKVKSTLRIILLRADVPNFFIRRKRRIKLVRRKPSRASRIMKATTIPRAKKALCTFLGGAGSAAEFSAFPAPEDFLVFKISSRPKMIKRVAKIFGKRAGPG